MPKSPEPEEQVEIPRPRRVITSYAFIVIGTLAYLFALGLDKTSQRRDASRDWAG